MASKAVCVLKSDKVNGVVHFSQEVNHEKLWFIFHVKRFFFETKSVQSLKVFSSFTIFLVEFIAWFVERKEDLETFFSIF